MPTRHHPYTKPAEHILDHALAVLSNFHPVSIPLATAFKTHSFEVVLPKGQYLLKQGEFSGYQFFLVSGVVEGYRIMGKTRLTTFITVGGDFLSAIDGMYGTSVLEDSAVAATDCYLIGLHTQHLLHFFDIYPEMNIIMRKILEIYYRIAHQRSVITRMGTAKEKYAYYLQTRTGDNDGIPLSLIASFLDIKTETLKVTIRRQSKSDALLVNAEHIAKLQQLISTESLFLEKQIRLKSIAQRVNLSPHELSALLNNHHKKNFTDFINIFRVNYVKEKLRSDTELLQLTIEALGDQAGFSSKSAFFFAFKKHTGMSPLEYIRANK
ncbi:helix-turn-helix domain-containing protein [Pedobacter duraquae]|uniref:Helix-turn-helix protein n=1 Tax=Pedobacter duraquae TaxID=425511 RepID=A0A4R6IAX7_9SPHI|nr:helix-turn-helix domain-containing protein [Pedobacter duraquae]TDO19062.1 helix-turn-helix protein [Pedobacter duraquae]